MSPSEKWGGAINLVPPHTEMIHVCVLCNVMQYMYIRRREVVGVTRSSANLKPAKPCTVQISLWGKHTFVVFSSVSCAG